MSARLAKYRYAQLALSSPPRFGATFDADPRFFVDLWHALGCSGDPALSAQRGVRVLSFPASDEPQACLHVAVWIAGTSARVFLLERALPLGGLPTAMLVEIDAEGRIAHGPRPPMGPSALADVVRALVDDP